MKKTILLILAIFIGIAANSQIKKIDKLPGNLYCGKEKNEDFFKNAEYIIEGAGLFSVIINNTDSNKVFSKTYVKVNSVLKGNLKSDTIQVIKECGTSITVIGTDTICNGNLLLELPRYGIYFLKKGKGGAFEPILNEPYAALYFSDMPWKHNFLVYGLKHMYFKTKEDFYKYASKFEGVTAPPGGKKKPRR